MPPVVSAFLSFLAAYFRSRRALQLEILALRHQLAVYQRSVPRPRIQSTDRLLWSWLARVWSGWQDALAFVQPRTVVAWQQKRFREHWRRLSERGTPGRPAMAQEVRVLIQTMWQSNPTWGPPRIVGELQKLGIEVAKSTVEHYRVRPRQPPSPTWRAFLNNHVRDVAAMDFFVVPTVTFKVLFVLVILVHERRRIVHVNVTEHPSTEWTAQQVVDAFPWETAPRYLLRDRDHIYGEQFRQRVGHMGIAEVLIALRSPWQNPYVERVIGSIRRDLLDHVIVFNAPHLRRLLADYLTYYHSFRTHLSLAMDCPVPRAVVLPEAGAVIAVPEVGGLHHHYERRAA
jgi:putative transposase